MPVVVDVRGMVEHPEGNVASAARDVEDVPALLCVWLAGLEWRSGVERADEVVLPQAMDA